MADTVSGLVVVHPESKRAMHTRVVTVNRMGKLYNNQGWLQILIKLRLHVHIHHNRYSAGYSSGIIDPSIYTSRISVRVVDGGGRRIACMGQCFRLAGQHATHSATPSLATCDHLSSVTAFHCGWNFVGARAQHGHRVSCGDRHGSGARKFSQHVGLDRHSHTDSLWRSGSDSR